MYRLYFDNKLHLASDVWQFFFTTKNKPEYIPGQYARIIIPGEVDNGRLMSLTSHPDDEMVSFITRLPNPASSFKTGLSTLSPGQEVLMEAPLGDFILPRDSKRPILFVIGGIGIASILSILEEIRLSKNEHNLELLWALKESDQPLTNLLANQPIPSQQVFIGPKRLQAVDITSRLNDDTLCFLSGTPSFVEYFLEELRQAGITDNRLVFDYFTGYLD